MKRMIFISVLIFSVMTLSNLNAEITELTELGQGSLHGWVENAQDVPMVIWKHIGAVKYALNMLYGLERGNKIFFALCEQIDEAVIIERDIYSGTMFEGMLFKSRGFQRVLPDVEWTGEPFKCFFFGIYYKPYWIAVVIPQKCGNISFLHLLGANEPVEEGFTELEEPRIIETEIEIESEELISTTETLSSRKVNAFSEIGAGLVRGSWGNYLPIIRIGFEFPLSNSISAEAAAGVAMPLMIIQSDKWHPFVITDFSLRYKFSKISSFGLGAGFSSEARENHAVAYGEGLANIGIHITKNTMFFLEARMPFSKMKNIGNFPNVTHKFLFGFRFFPDK